MSKFKVGQKIVFYDAGNRYKGCVTSVSKSGASLEAKGTDGNEFYLHVKQCRKLKPKAKTRRRFKGEWKRMYPYEGSSNQQMAFIPYEPFVDLASLEGKECDLVAVKGIA